MINNLNKLKVSLTKFGAFKVYNVLKDKELDNIISNISDYGHIDIPQARKNLSIYNTTKLPHYWYDAKELGNDVLRHLTLFSIICSHHVLIKSMIKSRPRYGEGLYRRDNIGGKNYTNIQAAFRDLNFISNEDDNFFTYDFSSALELAEFPEILKAMLKDKLTYAGMKNSEELPETLCAFGFHLIFGLKINEFLEWLSISDIITDDVVKPVPLVKSDQVNFTGGHIPRNEKPKVLNVNKKVIKTTYLYNEIQNKLFEKLSKEYGNEKVGTEQQIGRNRVDLVLNYKKETIFYEIKTSFDSKISIRDGLSQLMEYSYFPQNKRANKLVVVSPANVTKETQQYIEKLRKDFNIPLYYIRYNKSNKEFEKEI